MKLDDFRYMNRGKQISDLSDKEKSLIEPVNKRGKGFDRALLALHGFSSTPAVYRLLLPKLKHYDAIICPVLPGHAQSIEAFSKAGALEWIDKASQACETLLKDYKQVDVMGLSLGGILACEISRRFSLNHLYLLAPALKLNLPITPLLKLTKFLKVLGFKHLRNQAGNLITTEHSEIAYRKLPLFAITEILGLIKGFELVPPTCPVDLFLGLHDEVVNSTEVEALFAGLPNVTTHWLKNSAHVLPLDKDLDEIIKIINKS